MTIDGDLAEPLPEAAAETVERRRCDVLVIGGGPGGAGTAAFLARQGIDTVLVERDQHPRFHVGESLLPRTLPLLERLGILDKVRAIGVHKPGAEFISEDGEKEVVFEFARALLGGPGHAYQVRRAQFDEIVFRAATDAGARSLERTEASIRELDDDRAVVRTNEPDGRLTDWETKFLVDASGRSTITSKLLAQKRPDPRNTSAAIFGHFEGVPHMQGRRAGNIRIYLTRPGWMWQIPLPDGLTSMGCVAPGEYMRGREGGIEAFFRAHVARHPHIEALVSQGRPLNRLQSTGNFSYSSTAATGATHLKVGDAYGFLDPIFSTGVHLALMSAEEAAHAIRACLADPSARQRHLASYERSSKARLSFVSWFVYKIHDTAFRHLILHPRDYFGMERAIISLLAGDFRPDLRLRSRIAVFKAIRYIDGLRFAARERRDAL